MRYVGEAVAVVIAETLNQARDAAEAVVVDYEVLPAVVDIRAAIKPGAPQLHPEAPDNIVYDWHLGDKDATEAAFKAAANVVALDIVNNRLVPNAMEPRAAIGDYDEAEEHFTLYTTSQNPHVARLVLSAFIGIAPEHKLRVIAPDVGGGFGSKIFIYAGRDGVRLGREEGRPPGEVDRATAPRPSSPTRMAATTSPRPSWRSTRTARSPALRVKTYANLGAYLSTFSSSVPTYLYAPLLSGQYNIPAIYRRGRSASTPTPPRSTPIAAPAGRRRPSWSSG